MGSAKGKECSPDEIDEEDLKILTNFTPEELRKVHDDFLKESPTGQMGLKQFEEFYGKFFPRDSNMKFVNHLFRTFDYNSDGKINFKEFVCGISATTRGTPEEKLTWTFKVYDVNNDGTITRDEMCEIMRAICVINGVTEPEQLQSGSEAFEGLDANGDGLITVAEFVKGIQRDKRFLEMLNKTIILQPSLSA